MNDESQEKIYQAFRKYIPPPNPIFSKQRESEPQLKQLELVQPPKDLDSEQDDQFQPNIRTLSNANSSKNLVFIKWMNRRTFRNNINYFASNFFDRLQKQNMAYAGQKAQNSLQFDSAFEGANLLAAYKVNQEQYDLIMQNDTNSGGYTQWFNFIVSNRKQKGNIKFNIINFYKNDSLFKTGMKPQSKSLVYDKNWKRSSFNVEYYISDILMENSSKYYKILSFKYNFAYQNDSIQFSSCLPYTYQMLNAFIKQQNSAKLRVKYLGATPLKKIVTMLQISSENIDEKYPKKAVVLMGRQHSGETPSSYIIQFMIEQLMKYTQENQFLLSKYNFYVFPMVNVDGVVIGNYRCNLNGYDLNRYWNLDDSKKQPQISFIKTEIKRIMKKESIELILDIHGHSSKMNSFFYGNTFGKYNMIFPYVASKIEPFIDYNSCSFSDQQKDKSNTARAILGNLIKQTGSVYTFEVSLYGGIKNGKKVAFVLQNYQQIAKSLIMTMYKSTLEYFKEEKLLKESLYLKQIRKQLRKLQVCSDSEAKQTSVLQETIKKQMKSVLFMKQKSKRQQDERSKSMMQKQCQTSLQFDDKQYIIFKSLKLRLNPLKTAKNKEKKQMPSFSLKKIQGEQTNRKRQLMSKLRIFGETFAQESMINSVANEEMRTCTESQTNLTFEPKREKQSDRKNNALGPINPYFTSTFISHNIIQPKRRRTRISKSQSTKVDHSEVNFCDLIRHNKINLA